VTIISYLQLFIYYFHINHFGTYTLASPFNKYMLKPPEFTLIQSVVG